MQKTLKEMLDAECVQFVRIESFVRQMGGRHIRGLPMSPDETEIEMHRAACEEYYKLYGTRDGELSPWWLKGDSIYGEAFDEK